MARHFRRLGWLLAAAFAVGVIQTPVQSAEPAASDEEGFMTIFDGKTLDGWDGDPRLWSVVDGAIRGQTTPENPARGNTFCVWRGGKLKDFVLRPAMAAGTVVLKAVVPETVPSNPLPDESATSSSKS